MDERNLKHFHGLAAFKEEKLSLLETFKDKTDRNKHKLLLQSYCPKSGMLAKWEGSVGGGEKLIPVDKDLRLEKMVDINDKLSK